MSDIKYISGGVCAARGFKAAGMHCGVKTKKAEKKDVALIFADNLCSAAAVYTENKVKAAPLIITKSHLENGAARAVLVNSGNANACAANGREHAVACCRKAAEVLGIDSRDVIVSSTGVIGQELNVRAITDNLEALAGKLSADGAGDAADAIMTTDLKRKEFALETEIGGRAVTIGGMAKGSGMIHPNMGTMLAFITTDCAISADMLQKALRDCTRESFNRVSVDGDTSTNDMCSVMASGLAGNAEITEENADYKAFKAALLDICVKFSRAMAADGEGATHLITCTVKGASDVKTAEMVSKSVISSTLTKAAIFGSDANWGRILCAMGYSGAEFDPDEVDISFKSEAGEILVCKSGRGLPFDEDLAKKILTEHEVIIDITTGSGPAECTCWGCDITYEYIRINGDYRS